MYRGHEGGTGVSQSKELTPLRLDIDFPKSAFHTDPLSMLTVPGLMHLQQRLGVSGLHSIFRRRESQYRINGPHIINAPVSKKMRELQRRLLHLHGESGLFFGRTTNQTTKINRVENQFNRSDLIELMMNLDGGDDSIRHSLMVSRYVLLLIRAMGIEDREFAFQVEGGAILHDIGKIGIPRRILTKKGALSPFEKKTVREHPLLGYEMVDGIDSLKKSARIILFHHEKYDGSGYPYGLKEKEIPLEARIFALADALDAITADRHYSRGKSLNEAVREFERGRGSHFDPVVVDAFLSVPLDFWLRLKLDIQTPIRSQTVH